jgi:hypothetical protein
VDTLRRKLLQVRPPAAPPPTPIHAGLVSEQRRKQPFREHTRSTLRSTACLHRHELDCVVAHVLDARQHVVCGRGAGGVWEGVGNNGFLVWEIAGTCGRHDMPADT